MFMEKIITNILNAYPGIPNFFVEHIACKQYCIYFEDGIRINFEINDVSNAGLNNIATNLYDVYIVQSDEYGMDNK